MREKKRRGYLELAELATRQHGMVSARQLRELGFSENLITEEAKRGRLRRIHRGVYAVGHEALTWEGHCMAAVLANSRTVASHWTAGWLWGLLRSRPSGRFHLTAARPRRRRPEFNLHAGTLLRDDLTRLDGIPVTSVARTALDLTALDGGGTSARLKRLEDGEHRLDLREFEELLARLKGHKGWAALSQAVDLYRPDPTVTRSGLERRFRALIRRSGLPRPSMNFVVAGYELDCYWPEHLLAVELDTYGTHGSRLSFEEDRKRQRVLGLLGITLERVTDRQLDSEADEVLRAVAARLGAASYSPLT
jgi:predicted transcriptional regulator of viral defense system/very-short-patch-repair endonuclease